MIPVFIPVAVCMGDDVIMGAYNTFGEAEAVAKAVAAEPRLRYNVEAQPADTEFLQAMVVRAVGPMVSILRRYEPENDNDQ